MTDEIYLVLNFSFDHKGIKDYPRILKADYHRLSYRIPLNSLYKNISDHALSNAGEIVSFIRKSIESNGGEW